MDLSASMDFAFWAAGGLFIPAYCVRGNRAGGAPAAGGLAAGPAAGFAVGRRTVGVSKFPAFFEMMVIRSTAW